MKSGGWIRRDLDKAREWLERKSPMKKRNAKRAKKAHEDAFGPPGFVEHVHAYGCVVARDWSPAFKGCEGPIEAAHVVSRGAGGTWRNGIAGLCRHHHAEQHSLGIDTFEQKYQIDLQLWADACTHQWDLSEAGL